MSFQPQSKVHCIGEEEGGEQWEHCMQAMSDSDLFLPKVKVNEIA